MRVFGTRATFLYDDVGPRMYTSRDPGEPARKLAFAALPAGKGDLIPEFLDAVAGAPGYDVETERFFDGISVCLAADQAVEKGQPVTIEYP
jgi:hypothetical protein